MDGIDLAIPRGSFYGIAGQSGAGKTTLIRVLIGLLWPDSGNAVIDGVKVWPDPDEAKQHVGFLPDKPVLFDRLTGAEMLEYVGLLRRMEPLLVRQRAAELLRTLDLERARDRPIAAYSPGWRSGSAWPSPSCTHRGCSCWTSLSWRWTRTTPKPWRRCCTGIGRPAEPWSCRAAPSTWCSGCATGPWSSSGAGSGPRAPSPSWRWDAHCSTRSLSSPAGPDVPPRPPGAGRLTRRSRRIRADRHTERPGAACSGPLWAPPPRAS